MLKLVAADVPRIEDFMKKYRVSWTFTTISATELAFYRWTILQHCIEYKLVSRQRLSTLAKQDQRPASGSQKPLKYVFATIS